MAKTTVFRITLDQAQVKLLDGLRSVLGAATRPEVFRKALALASMLKDVKEAGNHLAVISPDGKIIEKIMIS